MVNIRKPPKRALKLVKRLRMAPIPKRLKAVKIMQIKIFQKPLPNKKGNKGMKAPPAKAKKEALAAPKGEPKSCGFNPSSSRAKVSKAFSGLVIIRSAN